jgi:hypothetical protein
LAIPPDGSVTLGSARLTLEGTDITSATAGPAQLSGLELAASINGAVGGSVLITGGFTANQLAGGAASLASDRTTLTLTSLSLNLNGTIDCIGGLCVALGTFPAAAVNTPVTPVGFGDFAIAGLGSLGAGTLRGTLPFNLGGNEVIASLVGQEVGRIFVPEPASGLLFGCGLAWALLYGRSRASGLPDRVQIEA